MTWTNETEYMLQETSTEQASTTKLIKRLEMQTPLGGTENLVNR